MNLEKIIKDVEIKIQDLQQYLENIKKDIQENQKSNFEKKVDFSEDNWKKKENQGFLLGYKTRASHSYITYGDLVQSSKVTEVKKQKSDKTGYKKINKNLNRVDNIKISTIYSSIVSEFENNRKQYFDWIITELTKDKLQEDELYAAVLTNEPYQDAKILYGPNYKNKNRIKFSKKRVDAKYSLRSLLRFINRLLNEEQVQEFRYLHIITGKYISLKS